MALTKITTSLVAVNSLTSANIADNSIDATKIAQNNILARHIPNATALVLDGGVTIDNITIDGTEIDLSSGDLTVDVAGDIILDADGGDFFFKDGGTEHGYISTGGNILGLTSSVSNDDIVFTVNDGGTATTALTLDGSEAGDAHFYRNVGIGAAPTNGGVSTAASALLSISGAVPEINLIDTDSGKNDYWIRVSDGLQFGEASDSRMYLANGGNLGIGTTTVPALLTLADHDDGTMNEMIRLVNDPGSSTSVGTGVQITFANHHSGTEVASIRSIAETTGAGTGLQFYTHSGSSLQQKLRINKDGNIFLTGGGDPTIPSGMASSSYVQLKIGGGILADSGHSSGHNIMLGNNVHVGASNDLKFTHAAAAAVINMTGGDINFRTHDGGGASADATASLTSRFYIKENGIIGIGTTSPTAGGLHISMGNTNSTGDAHLLVSKTGADDFTAWLGDAAHDYGLGIRGTGSYAWAVYDHTAGAYRARLQFGGDLYLQNTTVNSISDRRLKKNIVDANSQWNDIKALKWRNFEWKDEYIDGTYLGLIADEVESISPNLVEINAQPKEDIDAGIEDPKHKAVKYSIVWMKAMKALQEAQERIETLEAKVQALEG